MTQETYPLAYSTLGCPDWSFDRAAEEAAKHGYQGLEIRILDGEIIPADMPAAKRRELKDAAARHGIKIVGLGLSTRFSFPDPAQREQNLDQLRQYLALANDLECPLVRTFGGNVAAGQSMDQTIDWVAENLAAAMPDARRHGVSIALETHDAFCLGADVARVLAQVPDPELGALWDVHHPFRMGETVEETWNRIGDRLMHVHLKDAGRDDTRPAATPWQLVPMGEGEVPNQEILAVLLRNGYSGYLCAEWEQKWHPEIAGPDVAMPHEARVIRQWLRELEGE